LSIFKVFVINIKPVNEMMKGKINNLFIKLKKRK